MNELKIKKNDNKKTIIISVVAILIVLVIIIACIIPKNTNNKQEEVQVQEQTDNKKEYYYCYSAKDKEFKCGGVECTYTAYYKYTVTNSEQDEDYLTQHVDGELVTIYKFNEENISKADPSIFIKEGVEYKVDAVNRTYTSTRKMVIQPGFDIEFSVESENRYLESQGFYDCEKKYE